LLNRSIWNLDPWLQILGVTAISDDKLTDNKGNVLASDHKREQTRYYVLLTRLYKP